jgi:hypothetical protein
MTDAPTPAAPDLAAGPPRRWSAEIDGIIWLPRLIDKARAYDAGTLGSYLFGQSPLDGDVLHAARATYAELLEIVRRSADDRAVVEGLERHAAGAIERMRAFSRRPPLLFRMMAPLLDLDDGYIEGAWGAGAQRLLLPVTAVIAATLRRARPLRTALPLPRD